MAVEGSPEKFIEDIENFKKITWGKVNTIVKAISADLFESVIYDTPYVTGRAKNNWVFSSGTVPKFDDVPPDTEQTQTDKNGKKLKVKVYSDKSGKKAATKARNGLRRATVMFKKGKAVQEYYLTNQVPYIRKIEYTGWNETPPYRMVHKNLQRFANISIEKVQIGSEFKI